MTTGSSTIPVPPVAEPTTTPRTWPERAGEEWLRRLRILAVVVPAGFIVLVLVVRATFIASRWPQLGHLVLDVTLVAGSLAFGILMFSLIDRSYRTVLQENRDLAAVEAVVDAGRAVFVADEVARSCLAVTLQVTGARSARIVASHPSDPTRAPDTWHASDSAAEASAGNADGVTETVPLLSGPESIGSLTLVGLASRQSRLTEAAYLGIGRAIGSSLQRARYLAHLQQECHDGALAERDRIAREMHDGLAQALGAAHLRLHAVLAHPDLADSPAVRTQLDDLATTCHEAYVDVREAILGLRASPRHDDTLAEALTSYAAKFTRQSGIATTFEHGGDDLVLPPHHEIQVIRIVQEALTNVRKHSGATCARVRLTREPGAWIFTVEDDGAGFDPEKAYEDRFGLTSMSERTALVDGWLTVDSSPGRGTRITIGVPDPRGAHATSERTLR